MPLISNNNLSVNPTNISTKFRESFEGYTPGTTWDETKGTGDIIQTDGNALSASYLVISKDPLTQDTVSIVESIKTFKMPVELSVGLHMSQRVVGQEASIEFVSTEDPLDEVADIAISSVSQTLSTITVTTATDHNLVPGKRIGIYGVSDSRFNYPALVVNTVTSPTSFSCTAGPGGTIPSLTAGPYTAGYVYFRPSLEYSVDGTSQIFENTSVTNSSIYVRSNGGDSLPTGTAAGAHSVTIGSTASVVGAVSPYTYSFLPTTEYRLSAQADRIQWSDSGVDSVTAQSSRVLRTQVIPNPEKDYRLRFRFTNNKSLTVPTAQIVSAAKTGTTTAFITTATAHGLTIGDSINVYGIRDTTNFPVVSTAATVLSTPEPTTLTVTIGTASTATSYGGYISRTNGGNNQPGAVAQAVQSASCTATELTLIGSGTWVLNVGDYVNVLGVRDSIAGGSLYVDGVYKVVNVNTTTLVLIPLGTTVLPPAFTSTNCGGGVIRRTDVRISFVRAFDYDRQRVEVLNRPTGDLSAAVPIHGTVSASGSTIVPYNQNAYVSVSTTNLASNATFTGSANNVAASTTSGTVYNAALTISVQHTAGLVPGTLIYEVGTETSSTAPTTWYPALVVPIPSTASMLSFTVPISTRYYRLRFINGATAQTGFRLSTFLSYNGGGLGNALSVPKSITYPLSTTALASAGVFTGATLDFGEVGTPYQNITAVAYASHVSGTDGFEIQVSRDGTNWRDAVSATVSATTLTRITTPLIWRYARIVYTNAATLQTSFELYAYIS